MTVALNECSTSTRAIVQSSGQEHRTVGTDRRYDKGNVGVGQGQGLSKTRAAVHGGSLNGPVSPSTLCWCKGCATTGRQATTKHFGSRGSAATGFLTAARCSNVPLDAQQPTAVLSRSSHWCSRSAQCMQ